MPVPLEYAAELAATASALVNPGKGLLASDESPPTLNARLERAGLVNSEDTRRAYREALYTTPDLGTYVSGVILSADMLFEQTADGTPFVDLLNVNGIVPGVRVDAGAVQLPGAIAGETCSRGLDGLDERAALYREQGARFAKWRSRIKITGDGAPSLLALKENCWTMARCAHTLAIGMTPPHSSTLKSTHRRPHAGRSAGARYPHIASMPGSQTWAIIRPSAKIGK